MNCKVIRKCSQDIDKVRNNVCFKVCALNFALGKKPLIDLWHASCQFVEVI